LKHVNLSESKMSFLDRILIPRVEDSDGVPRLRSGLSKGARRVFDADRFVPRRAKSSRADTS
jgi:hypothetical protein